jgi:hypothetical protein
MDVQEVVVGTWTGLMWLRIGMGAVMTLRVYV